MIRYLSITHVKNSIEDISEAAGFAVGQNMLPPLEIAKHYLELASSNLKKVIKTESTPLLKTFAAFPDALETILSSLAKMNSIVFKNLAIFAESFNSFFLSTRGESLGIKAVHGNGLEIVKSLFWTKFPFDVFEKL